MAQRPRDPNEFRMSFGDHIEELRRRLFYILIGVAIIFCVCLYFGRSLTGWLYQPLLETLRQAGLPATTYTRSSVTSMAVWLKVSLYASLVLTAPWIFFHLWRFIESGLYAAERRAVLFLVGLSSLMTTLGLAFLYYLLLPAILSFLIFFTITYPQDTLPDRPLLSRTVAYFIDLNTKTLLPDVQKVPTTTAAEAATRPLVVPEFAADPPVPVDGEIWYNTTSHELRFARDHRILILNATPSSAIVPLIDPNEYLSETLWMALVIVLVFHVPVVMSVLGMTGLLDPKILAKYRRYIVFGLFIAALFVTPSQDLFSNLGLPAMVWLLFEFGLVLMRLFYRRHQAAQADDPPEQPAAT